MKKNFSVHFLTCVATISLNSYAADQQQQDQDKPSVAARKKWEESSCKMGRPMCGTFMRTGHVTTTNQRPYDIIAWVQGLNVCTVVSKNQDEPNFEVFKWDSEIIKAGAKADVQYIGRRTTGYYQKAVLLATIERMAIEEVNLVKPKLFWKSTDGEESGVVDLNEAYKRSYDMKVTFLPDTIDTIYGKKDKDERIVAAKEHLQGLIEWKEAYGEHLTAIALKHYMQEYYD